MEVTVKFLWKYVVGALALFVLLNMSDLNPLLHWESYRIMLNRIYWALPPGSVLCIGVAACLAILWAFSHGQNTNGGTTHA